MLDGECFGSCLLFWAAVRSVRFLATDGQARSDFLLVVLNALDEIVYVKNSSLTMCPNFLSAVACCISKTTRLPVASHTYSRGLDVSDLRTFVFPQTSTAKRQTLNLHCTALPVSGQLYLVQQNPRKVVHPLQRPPQAHGETKTLQHVFSLAPILPQRSVIQKGRLDATCCGIAVRFPLCCTAI